MATPPPDRSEISAAEFGERLFGAFLGSLETLGYYVGERLGWYRSLADADATAPELAARTATNARYAREWLELQAAFGILTVDDPTASPDERRFRLPAGPREALTDVESLAYVGATPRLLGAIGRNLDQLLDCYRHGGGVGWHQLGPDAYEAQAASNRPWFTHQLATALASVPDVDAILRAPGARVVDVGCGGGWSTLALAAAYPDAQLVGLDVDEPSLVLARANAAAAGVDGIDFRLSDGAGLAAEESYDAAFLFECLHDMPRPVEVLAALHHAVRPGGAVIVMDEAVAEEFTAPADEVDRVMYGYSLFICLPDGLSSEPSAGTGTVFRRPVLEAYAQQAGFSGVEVLPIEDFSFFRFYRLRH